MIYRARKEAAIAAIAKRPPETTVLPAPLEFPADVGEVVAELAVEVPAGLEATVEVLLVVPTKVEAGNIRGALVFRLMDPSGLMTSGFWPMKARV